MELHEIARWSVWPSLVCYSAAVGMRIGPRPADWEPTRRRLWIAGWMALVIHIAIAMGAVHHWSVSEAVEHTARQTQATVGWNWGGGVCLNFGTVVAWGVLLPFGTNSGIAKWRTLHCIAHFYLTFMWFNATIVFGSRPAQVAGGLICVCLTWRYFTPERPR